MRDTREENNNKKNNRNMLHSHKCCGDSGKQINLCCLYLYSVLLPLHLKMIFMCSTTRIFHFLIRSLSFSVECLAFFPLLYYLTDKYGWECILILPLINKYDAYFSTLFSNIHLHSSYPTTGLEGSLVV